MVLASYPVLLAFTSAPRSQLTVHGVPASRTAGVVVATETRPKFASGLLGKVLGKPASSEVVCRSYSWRTPALAFALAQGPARKPA